MRDKRTPTDVCGEATVSRPCRFLKFYLDGASEKSYDSHRSYNVSLGFLVEGRENVYTAGRLTLKAAHI